MRTRVGLFVLLATLNVVAPLVLSGLYPKWVGATGGPPSLLFELLGVTSAMSLAGTGYAYRARIKRWWNDAGPISLLIPALALHFLFLTSQYPDRTYDYRCYESAARDIVAGTDPYGDCYLYPPLLAQTLASVFTFLAKASPDSTPGYDLWWQVFYVYQGLSYYLVLACLGLLYVVIRRLSVGTSTSIAIVAAIALSTFALSRTLRMNQANLFPLLTLLLAMVAPRKTQSLAGALVAISVFVKPHLILLPIAWILTTQWRLLFGFAAGGIVGVAAQTTGFSDWTLVSSWSESFQPIAAYGTPYRNNSIYGFLYNAWDVAGRPGSAAALMTVVAIIYAALGILVGWRLVRAIRDGSRSEPGAWIPMGTDLVLLTLLFSPLVWPHQYLVLLPLIVVRAFTTPPERRVSAMVAAGLVLVLPTLDVFPISYHRLAGALYLLWNGGAAVWTGEGSPYASDSSPNVVGDG